jgi:5,10-methylenetetrahydromethanopterin reductase
MSTLEMNAAFATSMATPEHVAHAERLGYRRAWLYDSPALYPDVWATLAECARRTDAIGLGPGVLVPSLRHPMVNAAAIATLAELAPGRVNVAIGTGFTGRLTLGQRPLSWKSVREYVVTVQALLAGETATWKGARIAMLHPEGFGAARPLRVPMLLGTGGPKGEAAANDLADGIFALGPSHGFDRCSVLTIGTVLDDGEDPGGTRAMFAARAAGALGVHVMHLQGADVSSFPGGAAWLEALDQVPPDERHLALHDGHLIDANERDRLVVTGDLLTTMGFARTREGWHHHLDSLAAGGATEVAYQPAGPDIPAELERFAALFNDR